MEDFATCNPFVAMVCDENGAFGRPCYEMAPAGAPGLLPDSTGTLTPFPRGTGHHDVPDEQAPSVTVSQPNPGALPHSPPHDWHDCPSPFPACGVSREDALTPLQRAECRECHQGFGHD